MRYHHQSVEFRIADTFTDSLARLTAAEQTAVKTTAFDLQLNPAHPSHQFHKLEKPKDPHFWSVRVNLDIRLIVHRTDAGLLLCYVNHHDKAYEWAIRRRLETHPKTGAAQLIEVRETIREVIVPRYVEASANLLPQMSDDELLSYGIPREWLKDVRGATKELILEVAVHLPGEAADAVLNLATGIRPKIPQPIAPGADPFQHPDAQRRFRIVKGLEELQRALEFPWEKWTVFLHPEQRQLVERTYKGPARVAGSAGTGKTIVALHRAVHLARTNPHARVLLTTFSSTLSNALTTKLFRLVGNEPKIAEQVEVHSMNEIGHRLYTRNFQKPAIADAKVLRETLDTPFLRSEWEQVVDAWQLDSWEAYRDVVRLGRKTRLTEARRAALWETFEKVRAELKKRGLITWPGLFARLATLKDLPFEFVVVDEAQDVSISQLRFLAALGGNRPNALFFAGDLGQRIFQQPFSWKAAGIDVRGRSSTLKVNYRTSHQIRTQADRLLGPKVTDVDGNTEERTETISLFNGPKPVIQTLKTPAAEESAVAAWLTARINEGLIPNELGIFVRSEAQLPRATAAAKAAGLAHRLLDENVETEFGKVTIGTMHLAKGLEFRAVAVMACDDEVIPSQQRIETVTDDADLEEVYNTERHLLYVACTRARDHLHVSGVTPASEFLSDL
jgi:mRNA-degrading endonuclease RelE of RelBE toxin-antitoxin system